MMVDKEKILRGAEYCKGLVPPDRCPEECPYLPEGHLTCGLNPFFDDVITLLREQEPVKPVKEQIFSFIFGWNCGACGFPLLGDKWMYCAQCGRKIKWDD